MSKVGSITDRYFKNQWNLKLMNVPAVWEYTQGEGVVAGIIDSGVDGTHKDLGWEGSFINITALDSEAARKAKYAPVLRKIDAQAHPKLLPGWNFLEDNNDTWDVFRHGTYLAGTMAAESDGFGMVGVAPNAKIRPYVIVDKRGHCTQSNLARAIRRASADGCDVINISLAWSYVSQELKNTIEDIISKTQTIIVAATGNNNKEKIYYPAALPGVICVGGCTPTGSRWIHNRNRGSNYGGRLLCVTPGSSQISTFFMRWRFTKVEGTSQAAANMSGLIALLKSIQPNLTTEGVIDLIERYSSQSEVGKDIELGYGVPDALAMVKALSKKPTRCLAKKLYSISTQLKELADQVSGSVEMR